MGRDIKRVPLDFNWSGGPWKGYLLPDRFHEDDCPDCKAGYSPHAQHLQDLWYGHAPFDPVTNGSTPFTAGHAVVQAIAERNVDRSPEYYGNGKYAVSREANRLADLFNDRWMHHLNDDDVAALIEAGRLIDFTHTWSRENGWQKKDPPVVPTAAEVNEWSLRGFGHDSCNAHAVIAARCLREGVLETCETCVGHGTIEAYPGQRAEAEAWEPTDPPTGEGWQMWETVTEGSPVSPVFDSAEGLAQWLTTAEGGKMAGPSQRPLTISQAREFVKAGWAPSMVMDGGGLHDGATYIGTEPVLDQLEEALDDTPPQEGPHEDSHPPADTDDDLDVQQDGDDASPTDPEAPQ